MVAPLEDRSATGPGRHEVPAPDAAAVEADLAWRITRLEQLVAALGLLLERFRGPSPAFGTTVFDNLDDPAASNAVLAILVESAADARRDLIAVRRGVLALTGAAAPGFDHPLRTRLELLADSATDLTGRFEQYRSTINGAVPPRLPSAVARRHQVVALSTRSLLDIREVVDAIRDADGRRGLPAAAVAAQQPSAAVGARAAIPAPERRRPRLAALGLPIVAAFWRGIGRRRTRLTVEFAGVVVVGFVVLVSALGRGGIPTDSIPTGTGSGAGLGGTPGGVAFASGAPTGSAPPSSAGPTATGTEPTPAPSGAAPPPHATPAPAPRPAPTPNAVTVAVTRFANRITTATDSIDGLLATVATEVQDADFAAAKSAADGIAVIALTERSWLLSHPAKACYRSYRTIALATYAELITTAGTIASDAEAGDANAIHNDVAHSHLEVSTLKQAGAKAVFACA